MKQKSLIVIMKFQSINTCTYLKFFNLFRTPTKTKGGRVVKKPEKYEFGNINSLFKKPVKENILTGQAVDTISGDVTVHEKYVSSYLYTSSIDTKYFEFVLPHTLKPNINLCMYIYIYNMLFTI